MPDKIASAIRHAYIELDGASEDNLTAAVRSSATAEDLPEMSFAGQQETYLNIQSAEQVLAAVKRCWASLWTARAIGYRARHNIASADLSLAVVVQELVAADAAGILFTAHPVTGARDQIMINATWGLGEAIVSGAVTPDTILVKKESGVIIDQVITEKAMMTVRIPEGTREEAVPEDKRMLAVLTTEQIGALTRLGLRIERLYDQPMDIEWALKDGQIFIVQARPITTLQNNSATLEDWNDSLTYDALWSNGNLGEAVPDVMTPCTWSLIQIFMSEATSPMFAPGIKEYLPIGNIGGRFYMNISLTTTIATMFGMGKKSLMMAVEEAFGRVPADMEVPLLPIARVRLLRTMASIIIHLIPRVTAIKSSSLPSHRSPQAL